MAEHPDAARFRRVLEMRSDSDQDANGAEVLDEAFSDDVVWTGGPDGAVRGKSALLAQWGPPASPASFDVIDVFADGEHVVGVTEAAANGTRVKQVTVFHVGPDGNVSELWTLPADREVASALHTGEPVPEHPNLTRFRAAEEARARNEFGPEDVALIEAFLREDSEWHSPWGQGPSNREEVLAQFKMFKASTAGTLRFVLHEAFADDSHAVSLVQLIADRPDQPDKHLDVKEANVFHLDESGRAYEFWGLAADQGEIDAFWS